MTCVAMAALLTGLGVLPLCVAFAATGSAAGVEFHLTVAESDIRAVEVSLNFKLKQGEKALLTPPGAGADTDSETSVPQVELVPLRDPAYTIEDASPSGSGWVLTAVADGDMPVNYRVTFSDVNSATGGSEAPGGAVAPRAISEPDLKVFRASDVLMCPRRPSDNRPVADDFEVVIELDSGEKALTPWEPLGGSGKSFLVGTEKGLLENFITWGRLAIESDTSRGVEIITGFSGDNLKQSSAQRKADRNALLTLHGNLDKTLGERKGQRRLSVLLCGAKRFGIAGSEYETLLDSVAVFSDASELAGRSAAAAAGGLFDLWNRYSLVPKPGGESRWFQEGLGLFYPLRVAAVAGLMESSKAYEDFSRIYRSYLTDPLAHKISLIEAESVPEAQPLLADKGAAVVASIARKLPGESQGKVKDIDWLLGELISKHNGLQGKEYTLVDISELLEGATGKSWDRFVAGRVRGTRSVLTSEFSVTDLFGSTTGFGKGLVVGKGSGGKWIYLLIAILIILMIPVVFSPYVRRAVNLDMTMPKILPDDDDD